MDTGQLRLSTIKQGKSTFSLCPFHKILSITSLIRGYGLWLEVITHFLPLLLEGHDFHIANQWTNQWADLTFRDGTWKVWIISFHGYLLVHCRSSCLVKFSHPEKYLENVQPFFVIEVWSVGPLRAELKRGKRS